MKMSMEMFKGYNIIPKTNNDDILFIKIIGAQHEAWSEH